MAPEPPRDTLGTVAGKTGIKREMKIYRTVVMFLLVLIIVVFIGMFAAVFLAVEASKEVAVSHGQLTDTSGRGISTSQRHDSIQGIKTTKRRRLSGNGSTDVPGIEIPATLFYQTQENYTKGATEFVVPLPDGNAFTVKIKGWGTRSAWGKCATCLTDSLWTVSCPVDREGARPDSMCPVALKRSVQRELRERSLPHEFDDDEDEVFDRSLREKNCW